jgi:hypothetical protein
VQLGLVCRQISRRVINGRIGSCSLERRVAPVAACAAYPCGPIRVVLQIHAHAIGHTIEDDPSVVGERRLFFGHRKGRTEANEKRAARWGRDLATPHVARKGNKSTVVHEQAPSSIVRGAFPRLLNLVRLLGLGGNESGRRGQATAGCATSLSDRTAGVHMMGAARNWAPLMQ